ncbi:hypothetical protein FOCG_16757 [Fusarium oxysporum f. sp. radicis-lycopersici 26381]|nr:hypothetical protein FOCG_16757 [Fusarium oxysporum f. sp. radicis-lycopersici 26381]
MTKEMLLVQSPPLADWLEFFNSVRIHGLIRFGMWDQLKNQPISDDRELYCGTVAMVHYGRAIA